MEMAKRVIGYGETTMGQVMTGIELGGRKLSVGT
jgi:hypothetical protein